MMRLRRASAIVALCLLASAVPAFAECAWVPCGNITGPPDYEASISPMLSSDTTQQCAQSLATQARNVKHAFANSDVAVDKSRATAKTQAKDASVPVSVFRYQCLPDIVDPRGARGK